VEAEHQVFENKVLVRVILLLRSSWHRGLPLGGAGACGLHRVRTL